MDTGGDGGGGGGGDALQDIDCNIVLVGDSKCGKTALVERFVSDKFVEVYTPTGFEKYASTYNVADYRIRFAVWDTSGSAAYDTVRPLAYQDAKVFLLCFRVSDPDSLDNAVNKWYPEIRQHCDNTPVILCGCQSDLRNDIETISALAKLHHAPVSSEQAVSVSRTICANVRGNVGQGVGQGGARRLRGGGAGGPGQAQQAPRAAAAAARPRLPLQEQAGPQGRAQGPRQELQHHVMPAAHTPDINISATTAARRVAAVGTATALAEVAGESCLAEAELAKSLPVCTTHKPGLEDCRQSKL